MTIHQFLALFDHVKPTASGWMARCPAHEDRDPSLSIAVTDRMILIHCFAHCDKPDILDALGLQWSDLYEEEPVTGRPRPRVTPWTPRPPRAQAFAFERHALDCLLAADAILAAAARCEDCETWTDEDRDLAMHAMARAYAYQDRARVCEDYADHVREEDYATRLASRQSAAHRPATPEG